MKIVTIEGVWLLHSYTELEIDISSRLLVTGLWNVETRKHTRTHIHADAS